MDSLTSDGGVMMTTMVRRGTCSFIWALNRVRGPDILSRNVISSKDGDLSASRKLYTDLTID
jgi:hypothetical protein